jgi:hypothetical protein
MTFIVINIYVLQMQSDLLTCRSWFKISCRQTFYRNHSLRLQVSIFKFLQSQWPRSLRCGSVAVRLLKLWVRIQPGTDASCECLVSSIEVSATRRSLFQRSLTAVCVCVCDRETSIVRRICHTRAGCAMKRRRRKRRRKKKESSKNF